MAASREVIGGNSPAWLGPTLLGLGLVAWTGAGAMAHAGPPEPPAVETAEDARPELEPQADAIEDEEEAIVIVEDGDDGPELDARPSAASPIGTAVPDGCAPQVELMFANGESEVDRTEILRGFKAAAEQFPDHTIVVEGYASADGSEQGNLQLSYRRASRAKANLVRQGIDAERISVQAFGEYRPNLDGDLERDRRVIVKLQGVAACPQKAAEE